MFDPLLLVSGLLLLYSGPLWQASQQVRRGHYASALRVYQAYYRATRPFPTWRAPLALSIAACHTYLGEYHAALPFAEEAVRGYDRRGRRDPYRHVARAYLGITLVSLGEFDEAESLFLEALTATGLKPTVRAEMQGCLATAQIHQGRIEAASEKLRAVIQEMRPGSDSQILAECNLSICHYFAGDTQTALEIAAQATRKPTRWHWIHTIAVGHCLLYCAEMGRIAEAEAWAAQVMPTLAEQQPYVRATVLRGAAQLALAKGDLDRARDYAERAHPLAPNPNAQAHTLLLQAEVFAARHNAHRAAALCDEILRLPTMEFFRSRARTLQARLPAASSVMLTAPPQALPPTYAAPSVTLPTFAAPDTQQETLHGQA